MKLLLSRPMAAIFLILATVFISVPSYAATQVTLILGPLKRSVETSELRHLAETGEAIGKTDEIIRLAKKKPSQVRMWLNVSWGISLTRAAEFYYSPIGTAILAEVGRAIHPPLTYDVGVQALRAAFILSSVDGTASLIELLEQYPNETVWVDLELLPQFLKDLGDEVTRDK